MKQCSNWEYDIYCRLDNERHISATLRDEYIMEIQWCYRLEFIDDEGRDNLLAYLNHIMVEKAIEFNRKHELKMEQLRYEQELAMEQKTNRLILMEIFRR